jgi:hypothetical protein
VSAGWTPKTRRARRHQLNWKPWPVMLAHVPGRHSYVRSPPSTPRVWIEGTVTLRPAGAAGVPVFPPPCDGMGRSGGEVWSPRDRYAISSGIRARL